MFEHHSHGSVLLAGCIILLLVTAVPLSASMLSSRSSEIDRRFSRHYYGMHVDWDLSMDIDQPVRNFITSRYLGAGFSYGYGRSIVRPRARISAGWLWKAGFTLSFGAELPLIEILSPAQTKLFGVYITGDYGYTFGSEGGSFYRVSPYLRVPVSPLTGLMLGASYNSESIWSFFIGRSIGGYPLQRKNHMP